MKTYPLSHLALGVFLLLALCAGCKSSPPAQAQSGLHPDATPEMKAQYEQMKSMVAVPQDVQLGPGAASAAQGFGTKTR